MGLLVYVYVWIQPDILSLLRLGGVQSTGVLQLQIKMSPMKTHHTSSRHRHVLVVGRLPKLLV